MAADHPVVALKKLGVSREPYAEAPSGVKLKKLAENLSNPTGIARLAFEAMSLEAGNPKPPFDPENGMTPRQYRALPEDERPAIRSVR